MGGFEHPERRAALERILRRDGRHRWSRVAVESALGADTAATLIDLLGGDARFDEAEIVTGDLADLVGAGVDRDGLGALSTILRLALRPSALVAACRYSRRPGVGPRPGAPCTPAGSAAMGELLDRAMLEGPTAIARSAWMVRRALALRRRTSAGARPDRGGGAGARRSLPLEDRLGAVDLLALGAHDAVAGDLTALLAAGEPSEVEARPSARWPVSRTRRWAAPWSTVFGDSARSRGASRSAFFCVARRFTAT